MVYCHECGKNIKDSVKYCTACGILLKGNSGEETKHIKQTQTTVVHSGGGFFSGLFQGAGGIIGCCVGVIIIIFILWAIAAS